MFYFFCDLKKRNVSFFTVSEQNFATAFALCSHILPAKHVYIDKSLFFAMSLNVMSLKKVLKKSDSKCFWENLCKTSSTANITTFPQISKTVDYKTSLVFQSRILNEFFRMQSKSRSQKKDFLS